MENINNFKSFKNLKNGSSLITEDVIQFGDMYRVRSFDVPLSLISAFKKKAKDSGNDISGKFADTELAEFIAKYIQTTFLTIDNLPMEVLGTDYSQVQVQTQMQVQPQVQTQEVQNIQAQETAQDIPAQEGGQGQGQIHGQGQVRGQGQIQGQGTQGTQETQIQAI